MPDVSPDGKKLAFLAKGPTGADIHVMNVDGSNRRRLTNFNADFALTGSLGSPRWSPDGRKLIFARKESDDATPGIYTVSPKNGQIEQIPVEVNADLILDPDYSSDGSTIVFVARTPGGWEGDVRTAGASGGQATLLGGCGEFNCNRPTWSPDGSRIFVETNGGTIYVYGRAPGVSSGMLTSNGVQPSGFGLAFSPDGTRFVFQDFTNFAENVVIHDVTGGNPQSIGGGAPTAGFAWGR